MKKLFVYKKANEMDGYKRILDDNISIEDDIHYFTDTVALCYADTLEEAINIFSKMYNRESLSGYIEEAYFNKEGICICTDY